MFRSSAWLILLSLVFGAGCDLFVDDGDITVVGDHGSVFGSASPNALTVLEGGAGIDDASVVGRGKVITQGMGVPPSPGAGLVASGGAVVIAAGQVAGGNVVVRPTTNGMVNPTPAVAGNFEAPRPAELASVGISGIPLSAEPSAPQLGRLTRGPLLAPALVAQDSLIEIDGGTLTSSGVFGSDEFYVQVPAVVANGSELVIRGGEFRLGQLGGAPQLTRVVAASFSDVHIAGGHFANGAVLLQNSRTRITGGRFDNGLVLGNFVPLRGPAPTLPAPGCTEIRGGQFPSITTLGSNEQVFIFGTNFNRPLGAVQIPPPPALPSPLPANVLVNPSPLVTVSGTLEDGSTVTFSVGVSNGPARFVLVAPDALGCGFEQTD